MGLHSLLHPRAQFYTFFVCFPSLAKSGKCAPLDRFLILH
jgi:hypothetical protein